MLGATGTAPGAEVGPRDLIRSAYAPANRCIAIESVARRRFVLVDGSGYRAEPRRRTRTTGLYAKPTGLGTYMLYDAGRLLMSVTSDGAVGRTGSPGKRAEWALRRLPGHRFAIRSAASGRQLAVTADGRLVLIGPRTRGRRRAFHVFRHPLRCRRYPEAAVGARGQPFQGKARRGRFFGFADPHLHITADLRAGGRVISGKAFDRFGITEALGHDEDVHGSNGSLDITGNLLRAGTPAGNHDTHGWPTFAGWPVHDTNTHQQAYYAWLKRAWLAGERLVVAQAVEDEPLCRIEPVRSHSCDETETIRLAIRRLKALRDYVDAQSGGPGRGWFRLVYSPRQARRAIKRGKLAVLIGVESSNLFGCSEPRAPSCTRDVVDRGIRRFRRWGVRTVFVAHWVDNAFAGAALEGGAKGVFINAMERLQTGHYFRTGPCPQAGQGEEVAFSLPLAAVLSGPFPALAPLLQDAAPVYPPGRQCNVKGLTRIGDYLVRRLMANHMLIEADHLSERARLRVLAIAEEQSYPLVSSHTDTGGHWTASDLTRLNRIGGFSSATLEDSAALVSRVSELRRHGRRGRFFGVGLSTDTGGFNELPGPDPDSAANPLRYPFRSYDRKVRFRRQRSGERSFDLNADGVAHYGLLPDYLAETLRRPGGERALRLLFRSTQAYLDTWRRANQRRTRGG